MKHLRALTLLGSAFLLGGASLVNPKSQCEQLMNSALPFAEKMLTEHGEFYPYGETMRADGTIVSVAGYDGRERPPSQPIIDLLRQVFHSEAAKGTIIASALVYDVRTVPPGGSEKTDAIAVELDHRDNYSVVVYFPYSVAGGKLQIASPFATKGVGHVF